LPPWLRDLLERLDGAMTLRGFARETRRVYLAHVRRFYLEGLEVTDGGAGEKAPSATSQEVREWLLHLLRDGHSYSYTNQALSALRFPHLRVLGMPAPVARVPRAKRKRALPVVLSEAEVRRFPDSMENPKHRAMAFTLYSGGLRVSETAPLKLEYIDPDRRQIGVRQGKGRKDHFVMLSPVVLEVLGEYWGWRDPTIGCSLQAIAVIVTSRPGPSSRRSDARPSAQESGNASRRMS